MSCVGREALVGEKTIMTLIRVVVAIVVMALTGPLLLSSFDKNSGVAQLVGSTVAFANSNGGNGNGNCGNGNSGNSNGGNSNGGNSNGGNSNGGNGNGGNGNGDCGDNGNSSNGNSSNGNS